MLVVGFVLVVGGENMRYFTEYFAYALIYVWGFVMIYIIWKILMQITGIDIDTTLMLCVLMALGFSEIIYELKH